MPSFKLTVDSTAVERKLKRARTFLGDARDEFLRLSAEKAVSVSPVDTGTYITSHEVISGNAKGKKSESSHNKPRNQPRGPKEAEALSNLYTDIESLPEDVKVVSIRNNAVHARQVEDRHAPYAIVRREATRLAKEAVQRMRGNL